MVLASVVVLGQFALRINGSAKFASADHHCVLEEPPLLEVLDQGGGWLIHILALPSLKMAASVPD